LRPSRRRLFGLLARIRWKSSSRGLTLKFSAKGDVIVAGAAGEAALKVTLVSRRSPDEPGLAVEDGGESRAS
jgi:hypothetical protein